MVRERSGCITIAFFLLVSAGFMILIWSKGQTGTALQVVIPTDQTPTEIANLWQDVLRQGLNGEGSPVPTLVVPDQLYFPPTLARENVATAVSAGSMSGITSPGFSIAVTPTLPLPTATIPVTAEGVVTRDIERVQSRPTSPPALIPPLSRHINDHYWLYRPISSSGVNSINYYDYGTNGSKDAPLAIHHGVDLPNEIGTTVRATQSGTVIFATTVDSENRDTIYQNSPSYGRVVVIEHEFGYKGKRVYTLYAHLLETLVKEGDYVQDGDAVAQVGSTGHSTGGHVHFEVMVDTNSYGTTYNPALWTVPYVGRGTVAGRVVDSRGEFLQDVDVTLSSGGLVRDTTTTYVFRDVGSRVNPDPEWQENFVFSDVPVGRYEVVVTLNGKRLSNIVDVREGATGFTEFQPSQTDVAAPTAAPENS